MLSSRSNRILQRLLTMLSLLLTVILSLFFSAFSRTDFSRAFAYACLIAQKICRHFTVPCKHYFVPQKYPNRLYMFPVHKSLFGLLNVFLWHKIMFTWHRKMSADFLCNQASIFALSIFLNFLRLCALLSLASAEPKKRYGC